VLEQVAPNQASYQTATMTYSGSGDVTAAVTAVDVQIPPGPTANSSTGGCEAADFAGFPAGKVALIQRGTCTFRQKADNAAAAGASAVVVFNEGQPGRTDLFGGTLGSTGVTVPVVSASFVTGEELYNLLQSGPVTVHVKTSTESEARHTVNVLADTKKGDPGNVVVVGAHLDSVLAGPGINDNGSGSPPSWRSRCSSPSHQVQPRQPGPVRLVGAEELGLVGSTRYLASLSDAQKDAIALNLNFDMIGSPNFVRFIYDGDNSTFPPGTGVQAGPPGSGWSSRPSPTTSPASGWHRTRRR
jgi:Zn-dependent M28 family amino/carboxypeptidase